MLPDHSKVCILYHYVKIQKIHFNNGFFLRCPWKQIEYLKQVTTIELIFALASVKSVLNLRAGKITVRMSFPILEQNLKARDWSCFKTSTMIGRKKKKIFAHPRCTSQASLSPEGYKTVEILRFYLGVCILIWRFRDLSCFYNSSMIGKWKWDICPLRCASQTNLPPEVYRTVTNLRF